jgi:hypothetical protein
MPHSDVKYEPERIRYQFCIMLWRSWMLIMMMGVVVVVVVVVVVMFGRKDISELHFQV